MVNKKIVNISKCKAGDVLAEDIFNYNNIKIVSKNTVINEYIKKRLEEVGIFQLSLYIKGKEDSSKDIAYNNFKKEYEDIIISTQKLILNIFNQNKVNYDKVMELANNIYDKVLEVDYVMKYILDLQNTDEYTFVHSVNVAFYSMLIGKWMKMSEHEIKMLIQAGILHDIGKIKVDNKILNKPGKLTDEEFQEMKNHPLYGYDMIKESTDIDDKIKKAVLFHHERMDGSGYPYKLAGSEISLYARIIAIADTYDAMTSNRVYKKKVVPFKSFDMFLTEGIALYDVEVINAFLSNISTYYIGGNVALSNGQRGKIVYIPPYNISSPIVKVGSIYIDFSKQNNEIIIEDVTI